MVGVQEDKEVGGIRRGDRTACSTRSYGRQKKMSLREMCLKVERVMYTEDELQEVPIAYQELWEYLEEILEMEKKTMIVKREGDSS